MADARQLKAVFATAARNRRLLRVGVAFAAFHGAEVGVWVALLVFAYDSGGATAASCIALAQLLPAVVLAPWIGAWADRRRPGRVLLAGYLAQAATMALVATIMAVDDGLALVFLTAPLINLAIASTRSAQAALLPSVVTSPEELAAANAGQGWLESAGVIAAPLGVALLLGIGGPPLAVAGMATLAALGAVLVLGIDGPAPFQHAPQDEVPGSTRQAIANIKAIVGDPATRMLVGALGAQYVLVGALDLLAVVLAIDVLGMGDSGAGYLTAAFGVGGLLAFAVTASLVGHPRLAPALISGGLLSGGALLVLAIDPSRVLAFLLIAASGLGRSVFDVTGRTLLQRTASPAALAGAFGLLESLLNAGLAAGFVFVPILIAIGGPTAALAGTGAVVCAVLLMMLPHLRAVDAGAVVPLVELHLLRGIHLFAALPAPTLETLARGLERVRATAGTVVIRQGDRGDRYYAIAAGELDVAVDGAHVRTCRPPDGVGELALLHDTPRTATVTAHTDADLYALEREPFVQALTGRVFTHHYADWPQADGEPARA